MIFKQGEIREGQKIDIFKPALTLIFIKVKIKNDCEAVSHFCFYQRETQN